MGKAYFNDRRAGQVVAYFALKNDNKCINYMKVVKLVYLADRESIARFGAPILDDDVRYSMPHGPVNSYTKDFLSGDVETEGTEWATYVSDKENHELSAICDENDEFDELSPADKVCLDAVWDKFGHMSGWQLRNWTHDSKNIPEWEDPNGGATLIPLERIMRICAVENSSSQAEELQSLQIAHLKLLKMA